MLKSRVVYTIIVILIVVFIIFVSVLPRVNIETKNTEFSYKTLVFNESKVATIDIEIADEDWADMLTDPTAEEAKEATVTVNGKKVENVAIRTKGNSSLTSVANSDSERYSLKIDFDYYDSTQSLYGLKKLNLNNNFSDTTQMKEFVSYELMEKMGLPTPAHSYMNVTINGEEYGLYLGVEQVDETFLARNFSSNDGFLYKPDGTGSDLKWISYNIEDYTDIGLKTNEDNVDKSKMIDMLDAINNGGDLEKYLNVDNILRYFAMNTALVSLDSYQGQMKHNYYLYEEDGKFSIIPWDYNMSFGGFGVGAMGGGEAGIKPGANADTEQTESTGQRAGKNPIESETVTSNTSSATARNSEAMPERPLTDRNTQQPMDDSMVSPNMQQEGDAANKKDTTSNADAKAGSKTFDKGGRQMGGMMGSNELITDSAINFSITEPVSGTTLEDRPLLNALLSNREYRAKYEEYLELIATEYLTEDVVEEITMQVSSILLPYVESDPTKFSTTEEFLEGVSGDNSLPEFAKQRAESILKQLSGELVIEANTSSSGGMGMGYMPGGMQDGFDPTNLPEDFDPSQMPNGGNPKGTAPNDKMAVPGQVQNEETDSITGFDKESVLSLSISFIGLLLAILFAFQFKRRG